MAKIERIKCIRATHYWVVQSYYNVWLRSRETKEPIHEERMRMKYEYIIEEQDQDEVNHDIRIGSWQRTSVEITYNYSERYEAGEKNADGYVVWEYYEIGNNNADTIWDFFYEMIFSILYEDDSILGYDFAEETEPILETIDGERNAYFEYIHEYDERLIVRIYSPESRKKWNENQTSEENKVNESNVLLFRYFMNKESEDGELELKEIRKANIDLDKNLSEEMTLEITEKDNSFSIPYNFLDKNKEPINFGNLSEGFSWEQVIHAIDSLIPQFAAFEAIGGVYTTGLLAFSFSSEDELTFTNVVTFDINDCDLPEGMDPVEGLQSLVDDARLKDFIELYPDWTRTVETEFWNGKLRRGTVTYTATNTDGQTITVQYTFKRSGEITCIRYKYDDGEWVYIHPKTNKRIIPVI